MTALLRGIIALNAIRNLKNNANAVGLPMGIGWTYYNPIANIPMKSFGLYARELETMSIQKIYSNDPLIHYKQSTISPDRTKAEIDALLGYFGVSDVHWHIVGSINPWKPSDNNVYVAFVLEEIINKEHIKLPVRIDCPTVWNKANARKPEQINWIISMRELWWFLKSHLEMAYVMRASRIVAFLPYIGSREGHQIKDVIIPKLGRSEFPELTNEAPRQTPIVIDTERADTGDR